MIAHFWEERYRRISTTLLKLMRLLDADGNLLTQQKPPAAV